VLPEDYFCRGGPKDGQVLPGEPKAGYLLFDCERPWAYYKPTSAVQIIDRRVLRVAEYVGEKPPTH